MATVPPVLNHSIRRLQLPIAHIAARRRALSPRRERSGPVQCREPPGELGLMPEAPVPRDPNGTLPGRPRATEDADAVDRLPTAPVDDLLAQAGQPTLPCMLPELLRGHAGSAPVERGLIADDPWSEEWVCDRQPDTRLVDSTERARQPGGRRMRRPPPGAPLRVACLDAGAA